MRFSRIFRMKNDMTYALDAAKKPPKTPYIKNTYENNNVCGDEGKEGVLCVINSWQSIYDF